MVFSNPLKRAYKTAQIIWNGEIIPDERTFLSFAKFFRTFLNIFYLSKSFLKYRF